MSTKSFLLRLSKNSFSSFFLEKQERKAYIYILVISLFALLPLIQANALYVDDIKRVLTGFTEWGYDGRPLTTMLMRFLHIGEPLTDTSPASQVLAISIYSLCPIYASRQFDVKSRVFLILTGVIFTLNPFILQNYSYIFDSISMSLAALMATLAFTSISKELESPSIKGYLNGIFLGAVFLFSSLSLYQAAFGIFMAFSATYSIVNLFHNRIHGNLSKIAFSYITSASIALALYFPIKIIFVGRNYGLQKSRTPSLMETPKIILENFISLIDYLKLLLGTEVLGLLTMTYLAFIFFSLCLMTIKTILKIERSSFFQAKEFFHISILVMLYGFILASSIGGLNLLLLNPVWEPRVLMGFSALLCGSGLTLWKQIKQNEEFKIFTIVSTTVLAILFINISLTYGNVVSAQTFYNQTTASRLLIDLKTATTNELMSSEESKIFILGEMDDASPLVKVARRKYPFMKEMLPSYFRHWFHSYQLLKSQGMEHKPTYLYRDSLNERQVANEFTEKTEAILSTEDYNIYLFDENIFIVKFEQR